MKNTNFWALLLLIIALHPDLMSQINYSDNTISLTTNSPSAIGDSNTVNGFTERQTDCLTTGSYIISVTENGWLPKSQQVVVR